MDENVWYIYIPHCSFLQLVMDLDGVMLSEEIQKKKRQNTDYITDLNKKNQRME